MFQDLTVPMVLRGVFDMVGGETPWRWVWVDARGEGDGSRDADVRERECTVYWLATPQAGRAEGSV